jgi:anaerobic ribonucleoside-triphosphate reductase
MTQEDKELIEQPKEDIDTDADVKLVMDCLNPTSEIIDGVKTLVFDGVALKDALKKIRGKTQNLIELSNDLMGLSCKIISPERLEVVQTKAHESLKWMMANTPARTPLGVN